RPDVDGLYMEAVVTMTGHGGWPMTVFLTPDGRPFSGGPYFPPAPAFTTPGGCAMPGFLTPDGRPFYGGTYFPPEPRFNMPSFTQLLLAVSKAYEEQRGELEEQADTLVGAIRQGSERPPAT